MIGVRLMGGLGNQMFQYAIARKLANDHHTTAWLDLQFYEDQSAVDTPRQYELDCFALTPHFLKPEKRPIEPQPNYLGPRGSILQLAHRLQGKAWHIYSESHYNFDPKVLEAPDKTYLIGYWQTEKYFADIRSALLKDFGFRSPPTGENMKLLERIRSCEAVSIHVRRGDYVTNKNASTFHGTKDQAYYDNALSIITSKINNPVLFVFSDDPEWCQTNLKFSYETMYVSGNTKGFEDMRLMSQCKHNIIANSSFSWWAAWLNENERKIVVAPNEWFKDSKVDTSDVIPDSWQSV